MSSARRRDEAVAQLLEELRRAVRNSGKTQRKIERENDFQRGYLSQVLNEHMTLTARHIFGILFSLEIHPADFFARLFAESQDAAGQISEIRQRLTHYDSVIRELEAKGLVTPEDERSPEPENESEPSTKVDG